MNHKKNQNNKQKVINNNSKSKGYSVIDGDFQQSKNIDDDIQDQIQKYLEKQKLQQQDKEYIDKPINVSQNRNGNIEKSKIKQKQKNLFKNKKRQKGKYDYEYEYEYEYEYDNSGYNQINSNQDQLSSQQQQQQIIHFKKQKQANCLKKINKKLSANSKQQRNLTNYQKAQILQNQSIELKQKQKLKKDIQNQAKNIEKQQKNNNNIKNIKNIKNMKLENDINWYQQINQKLNVMIFIVIVINIGIVLGHYTLYSADNQFDNLDQLYQSNKLRTQQLDTQNIIRNQQIMTKNISQDFEQQQNKKYKQSKEVTQKVQKESFETSQKLTIQSNNPSQSKIQNQDKQGHISSELTESAPQNSLQPEKQVSQLPKQIVSQMPPSFSEKTQQAKPQQMKQIIQQKPKQVIKQKPNKKFIPPKTIYSKSLNLHDFSSQQPYLSAPPDIRQIFDEMIKRPPQKLARPTQIFMPSQKAYFAYRLHNNPQNANYLKAEYYYYDKKYNIGDFTDEIMLCIVAPGRNIVQKKRYRRFIDSIQRQNYTNYRLIYVDDMSDDGSAKQFENYVKSTQGPLSKFANKDIPYDGSFFVNIQPYKNYQETRRLLIIQNTERLYALANRNQAIRNYCPLESIVLDVDSDDAIIGKQAFKFINSIYSDSQVWMFNSVFIYDKSVYKEVTTGPQDGVPIQLLNSNTYRTSMVWKTSQLRTFKTRLFLKIDEQDFKDENGVFYQWASDVFTQQPLVQLAGPNHYRHEFEIVYYYDWDFDLSTVSKRRHYRDIVFKQTPYKPLQNLDSLPLRVENYVVPDHIIKQYEKNIIEARKQATKYKRPPPF